MRERTFRISLDVVNDNSYPKNPGFQTVHWHEDIQFIYVFSGSFCRATSFYPYRPKRIKLFRKML